MFNFFNKQIRNKSISRIAGILVIFILAGCATPNQLGMNAYDKGDYDLAAKHWNLAVKDGDMSAQYNLGLLWENGYGSTPKNTGQASRWYIKSAKQGFTPAMVRLGVLQKKAKLETAALSWLNLAARLGDMRAGLVLKSWGEPVPSPDLLAEKRKKITARKQRESAKLQESMAVLGALVMGVAKGLSGETTPSSLNSSPSRSSFNSLHLSPSPSAGSKSDGRNKYKYKGFSGQRYQYDLSNPTDQLQYDMDINAQMKDSMNISPNTDMDRDMGQSGAGIE